MPGRSGLLDALLWRSPSRPAGVGDSDNFARRIARHGVLARATDLMRGLTMWMTQHLWRRRASEPGIPESALFRRADSPSVDSPAGSLQGASGPDGSEPVERQYIAVGHSGVAGAPDGRLRSMPWVTPSREYLLLAPARPSPIKRLLVLLHGCGQTPAQFAAATGVSQLVERGDWLVLMPAQSRAANGDGCWNWFDSRTAAGAGEAAIVLAAIEQVAQRHDIDADNTFIAGISSGAALAAAIAANAPHRFAAAAFHSGIAMGATTSALRARRVMQKGPDRDVTEGLPAMSRLPALVIHGMADKVVAPCHADELMRQMLAINGRQAPGAALPAPTRTETSGTPNRTLLTRHWGEHRQIMIRGLSHAWSGGSGAWPGTDPDGPNAIDLMAGFFMEHDRLPARALYAG